MSGDIDELEQTWSNYKKFKESFDFKKFIDKNWENIDSGKEYDLSDFVRILKIKYPNSTIGDLCKK